MDEDPYIAESEPENREPQVRCRGHTGGSLPDSVPEPLGAYESPDAKEGQCEEPSEGCKHPRQGVFLPKVQQEVARAHRRSLHPKNVREAEGDDKCKAHEKPLMDRSGTLTERLPLIVDVDTGVEQGNEKNGVVVTQWHRHFGRGGAVKRIEIGFR